MTSLESKLKKILNKIGREKAVCPEQSELAAFVDGSLGPADEARTKHHLAGCAKCAELVRISLELEEEMPQRAPEAALDSAKAAFKPTLSKRARHFAEELLNGKRESGQEPAPALAVRAAESLRKPSSREYAREFCGYLMEATIEHVMGDQYQVIIRMKDSKTGKSVSGIRVSLSENANELESLMVEKGSAIFEPVLEGDYLLAFMHKGMFLNAVSIRLKGEGK